MLRAIAASKKKNDRIDAGKIADCLRCDFLQVPWRRGEIQDRRRTLRYRSLVVKQMVQMKNRVSGLPDGDRGELQQAAAARGRLLRRADDDQQGSAAEHPAATEAGRDMIQPVAEAGVRVGQFSGARSTPAGAAAATENGSGRGSNQHGRGLSRQGDAHADFQAAEQAHPASADRGCQAGAQAVSRTRPDPRQRTGERTSEPRHVGCCQEDGLLHARRRAQTAGLRACRRVPPHGRSVKDLPF